MSQTFTLEEALEYYRTQREVYPRHSAERYRDAVETDGFQGTPEEWDDYYADLMHP